MATKDIYSKQDEDSGCGDGGVAVDPQGINGPVCERLDERRGDQRRDAGAWRALTTGWVEWRRSGP